MNKNSTISIKAASGGATAPAGFLSSGVACGVRKVGELDLGLLFSEYPCDAAAVFTRNAFKGAPLGVTREAVEAGGLRAVVVNSGNANAATGRRGVEDAYAMQAAAGEALGVEAGRVAVASTGVIGEHREFTAMYPSFIEQAKIDQYKRAERTFDFANQVEEVHHDLFQEALKALDSGQEMKDEPFFVCPVCGYTVTGEAPENCPVCGAPAKSFMQVD